MRETITTWVMNNISLHDHYNLKEERLSGYTHLAGAILSMAGLVAMIVKWVLKGSSYPLAALVIFGLSMVILYSSSSLYHLSNSGLVKRFLRIMDHYSIYLLIAGTYTPLCVYIGGDTGTLILILIWSIALVGMIFKILFWGRLGFLHVAVYLAMGWLIVLYWRPVAVSVPGEVLPFIIGGGLTYTLGIIFYALKKLPFSHGIWHVFVMGGSAFFFAGIFLYIV